MALQLCSSSSSLLSLCSLQLLRLSPIASPSDQFLKPTIMPQGILKKKKQKHSLLFCRSSNDESNEDYYLDAPVSVGDGFSFSGGKYSDEPSPADEWFEQGKIVKAHPVGGTGDKAKDPIFGLAMGGGSQTSSDLFRDYRLKHALSAYSYRKVLPILSKKYHAIAFDWLGFGFSDKPQPRYGFDYTLDGTCIQNPGRKSLIFVLTKKLNLVTLKMDSVCSNYCMPCMVAEYTTSLESIIDETTKGKATLVVQGYFSPVVVKYASSRQEKITDLILLNPPLTAKHANLPSTLSIFSNFLLGEIFSQDPLRASDKALTSCGPYVIKEDVAMVYRRPYLTSGSAGFALNAISRAMKKELKPYIEEMRRILMDENWQVKTTIIWGERDRWLSYNGVQEFCIESKHRLIRLPMVISYNGLATLRPKLQYGLAN